MAFSTDSKVVQDQFDELFSIDHGKRETVRDKYRTFHMHHSQPDFEGEGPIRIAPLPDGNRLVTIVFSTALDTSQEHLNERLKQLRTALAGLLTEGEHCHLFVEDAPQVKVDEQVLVYEAKGFIARLDSSESM